MDKKIWKIIDSFQGWILEKGLMGLNKGEKRNHNQITNH